MNTPAILTFRVVIAAITILLLLVTAYAFFADAFTGNGSMTVGGGPAATLIRHGGGVTTR
jgi:hypothetical protein